MQPEAALQDVGEVLGVARLGEAPDLGEGADHLRREPREDARHPRAVALGHARLNAGFGYSSFQPSGSKSRAVEVAEHLLPGLALRAIPRALERAERDEVRAPMSPKSRRYEWPSRREISSPGPLAAEAVARVEVVVADVAGRRVASPSCRRRSTSPSSSARARRSD